MSREGQIYFLDNHTGPIMAKREPVSADIEKCIRKEFATFEEARELIGLWYDKERSEHEIDMYFEYGNASHNGVKRENIIFIMSDFTTGENAVSMMPNSIYTDWKWILLRDDPDSPWVVADWGY